MSFKINEFRASMRNGGLRTNLFEVIITNPIVPAADGVLPFRCKAAALPESNINEKVLHYMGRPVKYPGNRTYESWRVTIIEDEDYVVRDALEAWNSMINAHEGNNNRFPTSEASLYKSIGNIRSYDQNSKLLTERQLIGVWPQLVGAIGMTWDSDEIATYDVTFSYDYWQPTVGGDGVQV